MPQAPGTPAPTPPTAALASVAAGETPDAAPVSNERKRRVFDQAATRAIAAPVDPNRVLTSSTNVVDDPHRFACSIAGGEASCALAVAGPVMVTDYVALDRCPDHLYLASISTSPKPDAAGRAPVNWVVPVTAFGTHGAKLWVNGGERLYVAAERRDEAKGDSHRCCDKTAL